MMTPSRSYRRWGSSIESDCGRHARLGQPWRAARGGRKTTRRIVPRDDRHGVRVQVVGMFVGQDDQIGPDFLGRDRRQRQSLEAEQPFGRVGEIRVEIDDLAGGRFEDEPRLTQPPQRHRALRHFLRRASIGS